MEGEKIREALNPETVQRVREKLIGELEEKNIGEAEILPTLFSDLKEGKKIPQSLMLRDFVDSIGFEIGLDENQRSQLASEIFEKDRWFKK